MIKTLFALVLILLTATFVRADLSATSTVDETLDALYQVGKDLKSFTADVKLTDEDKVFGDKTTRVGKVWYQKVGEGGSRIRVALEAVIRDGLREAQKRDMLLDKGVFTDRDYEQKKENQDELLRPGEKVNLLTLDSQFPFPVGQKPEEVKKHFAVERRELASGELPDAVHLVLTPKPESHFARKFSEVEIWVDHKTLLPRRIDTTDVNQESERGTEIANVKINAPTADADFILPQIANPKEWTLSKRPYQGD